MGLNNFYQFESELHNQSYLNQNNNKLNYDTSFQFRTGLQNFFEAERWNVGILRLTEILSVCHLLPIWQHPLNSNIDQSCSCQKKQFLNPFVIFRFTEILSAYCLLSTWLHPILDASLDELYSGMLILKKEDIS